MSDDDPGLQDANSDTLPVAAITACPALLHCARRAIADDLADYPGVLVWAVAIADGHHVITAPKYPPEYAALALERRRHPAPRDEDAALPGERRTPLTPAHRHHRQPRPRRHPPALPVAQALAHGAPRRARPGQGLGLEAG